MRVNSRIIELSLFATAGAVTIAALGTISLASVRAVETQALLPGIVILAALLAVHALLAYRRFHVDSLLLGTVTLLSGLGLATVTRLRAELGAKQAIWILIGVAVLGAVVLFPRPVVWLRRYKYTWALLGLALIIATLAFGRDPNQSGARLWLGFNDLYFQPSELLKVLLVVFLAAYLDDKREMLSAGVYRLGPLRLPPLPSLGPLLVMWGLAILVLFGQRDLGPTFLLFGVFISMLYVATARRAYIWSALSLFVVAFFIAIRLVPHAAVRFAIWLDPFSDPLDRGYQVVQALVAIASGGVFGTGLSMGSPDLIPAAYTDFPFAALAEETGMAGVLAVLALYMTLIYRGLRIAVLARDSFQQLLALGLAVTLGLQTLIIIGGNLRLMPLTGITLPFISYGGSSLLANFLIVGLLLRISQESSRQRLRA